jgi:glutathione S-transferase
VLTFLRASCRTRELRPDLTDQRSPALREGRATSIEGGKVRLYDYAASANCYKPRLLLALLGREYERFAVDIFAGDTLTEEYAKLNPARETPVLELDDGRVLTQSNAILWYLAEESDYLPREPFQRGQIAQWLFFEQERVMSGIGAARFRILTGRNPELVPARFELGRSALETLQAHLDGRSFLVGDTCTIADLANFAYTHVAEDAGYDLTSFPAVAGWLERITELPRFMDNLAPYPKNAQPGASRSIYDE